MGEQDSLEAIGVVGEWIWGDDTETIVYTQAFGNDKTLIFRFSTNEEQPQSLTTRIVNCFHDISVESTDATFADRRSMRESIWSAVASTWVECSELPTIEELDVVIDIKCAGSTGPLEDRISWNICHENLFNHYIDLLLPPDRLCDTQTINTVDFKSLVRLNQLGGRGCATLVRHTSTRLSQFVFKGIDFRTFLTTYESGHIQEEVNIFYRSIELLNKMPPHPNIMVPAKTLVTICKSKDNQPRVCGSLHPLLPNGNLGDHIEENNNLDKRIPLSQKAKWCYQMGAAVAHTHFVAHTYHTDIKPGNFLLDEDLNVVLIDWEQNDTPVTTAAPEIDSTWDVREISLDNSADTTTLQYTKYVGPERRNMPITTPGTNGWNIWNVYPLWNKDCRKALELAEVFSLGRSMWMLLRQPDMDAFSDITSTQEVLEDWESSEDIPASWKRVVQECMKYNPNERIRLHELVAFWDSSKHETSD